MKKITKASQSITNDHGEEHTYVFEEDAKNAINAALLINRPLLIRGEPGVGKSQLAKAAAEALKRAYIPFVVNASTESQDLLWSFDGVARLADAQIEGSLCNSDEEKKAARDRLALHKYIKPAALWATLNWKSAKKQFKNTHNPELSPLPSYQGNKNARENGVVLLIDEIDKADSSVPNGLLEVLGSNRFHPDGLNKPVEVDKKGVKPLIIITTNEERTLPDAFIRRCLSVTLVLPKEKNKQIDYLVSHAEPNFKTLNTDMNNDKNQTILEAAAEMVLEDRAEAKKENLHPLPGQAEYFDLLRGIEKMLGDENNTEGVSSIITLLSRFTSKKHPDFKQKVD